IDTGEHLQSLGRDGSAQFIAISPDGGTLAVSSRTVPGGAIVWDLNEHREMYSLAVEGSSMDDTLGITFSPDGRRIANLTHDGYVRVWNRYGGARLAQLGPYEYDEGRYMLGG